MSEAEAIAGTLAGYLEQRFTDVRPITPETDLLAAGLLESLTIMELLAYIEHVYGVTCDPSEIRPDNFRSAQRLAELIDAKRRRLTVI